MAGDQSTNEQNYTFYIEEPPINSYVETFFAQYASISSSALREHLISIRERAWKKFNYPCLGRWAFLQFAIRQSPIYQEIVDQCRNEDATVIDFGCCLGQDVRQLIFDGVPLDRIRAYELDSFFIEQGYQLFGDRNRLEEKNTIRQGDIFDDQFLDEIHPCSYLYVGSFIHLFDSQTQKEVCRRLTRICQGAITGRQVGATIPVERARNIGTQEGKMMCHSPASFTQMWEEVTNGEWKVEYAQLNHLDNGERLRQMLFFVVRKQNQ